MSTTIILNAMQKDFYEQMKEAFACYTNSLDKTKISIILFSSLDKKDEVQNSLASKSSILQHIEKITIITTEKNSAELQLDALCDYATQIKSSYYIFPSNLWGKSICTRFAYRIDGSATNNIIDICNEKELCRVKKYSYANNCMAEFTMHKAPYCISLAKDAFEFEHGNSQIKNLSENIEYINWNKSLENVQELSTEKKVSLTSLNSAKFVVICGQGIDSKEKIKEIRSLAESIGAEFGVTRPVAMNAHESIDRIVGISGNICKADICISIGTSGAGAYYAGIEKCKQIIAVNTNEKAAIMEKADIVVNEDGLQFMQTLVKIVKNSTNSN